MSSFASTITVKQLIDYARTNVKMIPLVGVGGLSGTQPALTIANKVKKRIIHKRYNWDWNRASIPPFKSIENRSEYVVTVPDVGWLERAYAEVFDSTSVPKDSRDLYVKRNLIKPRFKGDPQAVAIDTNPVKAQVIRVYPIPNNIVYQFFIDYQRTPTFIESLDCANPMEGSFAPIPDTFQDILTQLFLAFCFRHAGEQQKYYAELAEGLRMLDDMAGYNDIEEANTGFVPEFNPYSR